jgi:UBX domain-containing protein 7
MDQESISTFCGITGASTEVAEGFLSLSNNDVSRAIELYFENPELASNVQTSVPSRPAATGGSRTTREGSREIIHIDSDDDDVMQVDDFSDQDDDRAAAQRAAALAQEDEDAAMARRLQDELYGEGSGQSAGANGLGDDGVRAPIGRTTETLIAPNPAWADDEDDGGAHAAMLEQLRRRRPAPGKASEA